METVRLSDKLELTRVIVGCMRMMDAGKKGKDLLRFVHECMEETFVRKLLATM